jgi:hypothetical protein
MINKIYIIDMAVVSVTVMAVLVLVGYTTPAVIAPLGEFNTTNSSVLFEFKNADTILISDNPEFRLPLTLHAEDNLVVSLKPGTYFWKIKGVRESEVRKFTIVSDVDLRLEKRGEGYAVTNAGNVPLSVQAFNDSVLTGNFILDTNSEKVSSGTLFVGRENDSA